MKIDSFLGCTCAFTCPSSRRGSVHILCQIVVYCFLSLVLPVSTLFLPLRRVPFFWLSISLLSTVASIGSGVVNAERIFVVCCHRFILASIASTVAATVTVLLVLSVFLVSLGSFTGLFVLLDRLFPNVATTNAR